MLLTEYEYKDKMQRVLFLVVLNEQWVFLKNPLNIMDRFKANKTATVIRPQQ